MPYDPVKSFPFLFYLQITSGIETRKERSSQTQQRDHAVDLSLSRSPSPFWLGLIVAAPCRSRSRLRANRDRSTASRDLASCWTQLPLSLPSSLNLIGFDDIFFLGFVCVSVLRNEWYYIFFWQPRKCEQQVENVFSMVFSGTQPNTKKYFSKHFLKCNQTHENIFISRK